MGYMITWDTWDTYMGYIHGIHAIHTWDTYRLMGYMIFNSLNVTGDVTTFEIKDASFCYITAVLACQVIAGLVVKHSFPGRTVIAQQKCT